MTLELTLLGTFVAGHPADAARALRAMEASDVAIVLAALPSASAASLLALLPPLVAARALESLEPDAAGAMLSATPPAAAAPIARAMTRDRRSSVLEFVGTDERKALSALLRYSPGTAGAVMDPEVLSVPDNAPIGETLAALARTPQHSLYYVYVVDHEQKLVGVVNTRQLMENRSDTPVGLVANHAVESLPTRASSESIVAHPGWKRFHAMPVVEADGRFVGVIRYESLRELEEQLLAGASEDQGAETAAALGELYGLGLRGMFEWAASAFLGSDGDKRSEP